MFASGSSRSSSPTIRASPAAARRTPSKLEAEGDHYVAIITDGKGEIPNGTRIPVSNRKMKWDAGNPTGHGIIFIGPQRQVYCYVTPGGL